MEFSYPEDSSNAKSSCNEETDDTGTGRSYECVFCKRGFTTAQALGGHMNIHRKDRANNNKTKPNFPSPSSSSSNKVVDDNNYADLGGFYSGIPSHLAAVRGGNYYYSSTVAPEVDTTNYDYHQIYFPAPACGARPSHVQYGEVLSVENQRNHGHHPFGQDYWRQRSLSLYANPLCVRENEDKVGDNSEENGPDLELRLGHHP